MIRLTFRNRVPYGGLYSIKDKLTGQKITGTNFDMVMTNATNQRRANGVPMGLGFEDEVETWICESYPQECEYQNPLIPRSPKEVGMTQMVQGTRTMLAFLRSDQSLVDQGEAERRAAICAGCRFNQPFRMPCSGICGALLTLVEKIINHQGTSRDADLKACSVCSCFNRAQVWVPLEVLDKGLTPELRSQFKSIDWCWKKHVDKSPV